ncbi:MAG: PilZ domain-containing protein [Candidatus Gastranaerophilales bacterium]|nr:PilZ domain-containing protein [Candidatus Gastranaerophilales bacterium]
MKELLKSAKDFKIIPSNFKSSGAINVQEITDEKIKGELVLIDETELKDYPVDSTVEIFGVNSLGLIYFETKIIEREDKQISFALTSDYSIIQRREYSRVGLNQGTVTFKDIAPEAVLEIEDISAGGIKLTCATPLEIDKYYDIEIKLSNNMTIECALAPIRIKETEHKSQKAYSISGKFVNLENADRIVLVQYAFKIKMEEQNKENE